MHRVAWACASRQRVLSSGAWGRQPCTRASRKSWLGGPCPAGDWPCSGRCGESRSPELCLCLEASAAGARLFYVHGSALAAVLAHPTTACSCLCACRVSLAVFAAHPLPEPIQSSLRSHLPPTPTPPPAPPEQVTCCFAQSVASTRWGIQDEMHLQNTQCDNCEPPPALKSLLACSGAEQRRAGAQPSRRPAALLAGRADLVPSRQGWHLQQREIASCLVAIVPCPPKRGLEGSFPLMCSLSAQSTPASSCPLQASSAP